MQCFSFDALAVALPHYLQLAGKRNLAHKSIDLQSKLKFKGLLRRRQLPVVQHAHYLNNNTRITTDTHN